MPSSIDTFNNLLNDITKNTFRFSILIVTTKEVFFWDQIHEKLLDTIPETHRVFNYHHLRGSEVTISKMMSMAQSIPLMATRRLIVVHDVMDMMSHKEKSKYKPQEILLNYARHPSASTLLLMGTDKPQKENTTWWKELKKIPHVRIINLPLPTIYQVLQWLKKYTQNTFQKKLTDESAVWLTECIGTNLKQLHTNLEKICDRFPNEDHITVDHLRDMVHDIRELSFFEIHDALINKNKTLVFKLWQRRLKYPIDVSDILMLISMCYNTCMKIWNIIALEAKNYSQKEIQKTLKINSPWYFTKLKKLSQHYSLSTMKQHIETLLDTEAAMKGFSPLNIQDNTILFLQRFISLK